MLRLDAGCLPRAGDLVLCDAQGWGDIRRILRTAGHGAWTTVLDPVPGARELVPKERVLAVVVGRTGAGGLPGWLVTRLFPLWAPLAATLYGLARALEAPMTGDDAAASVRRKYASQVDSYTAAVGIPPGEELRHLLSKLFVPGGSILVAGCGAGGEVLYLARAGYRVTGCDVLGEMIQAARGNAAAAGVDAEFVQADMTDLDLPGRRFDGIYVTPLVYSFVPGRARRVRCLQRLRRHLKDGAPVVFSVDRVRSLPQRLQLGIAWGRHRRRSAGFEWGDWHTSFMLKDGTIGRSYTHLFTDRRVVAEAREAGFGDCDRAGAYFVARAGA